MTLIPELRADLQAAAMRPDRIAHRWTRLLRRPKLFIATGGITLAGAIIAVVLVLSASSATSPAYALTRQPDGAINLTLYRLANEDIPALNARLAQMGIDETIVPVTSTCKYLFPIYPVGASITVTLRPHHYDLAPGTQGVMAAQVLPNGKIAFAQGALKRADIPPCVATVSTYQSAQG